MVLCKKPINDTFNKLRDPARKKKNNIATNLCYVLQFQIAYIWADNFLIYNKYYERTHANQQIQIQI